ncbi:MAG: hypothetical protein AAFZ15_16825 [Bacteroidota bacterium]
MNNFSKKLVAILFGVVFALVLLEIACQVLYQFLVVPSLTDQQNNKLHYYIPSDDPRLSYQMKPNYRITHEERRLAINKHGFRDDSDETSFPATVALFGDSVPFGQGIDQSQMPSAELQQLTGDSIKVVNFGTCGYGLEELEAYLETKYNVYQPNTIYYFLNLNDFSRRNSIYEGGDNGLYRIYKKPFFKLPFFIRKAMYRYVKEGKMSSVKWYTWMYEGNKDRLLPIIPRMAGFAKSNGSEFKVLLFPPAVGYENGTFLLQDIFDEISVYLKKENIDVIAPVEAFSKNTDQLQDNTDHFEPPGSKVIAQFIWADMLGDGR